MKRVIRPVPPLGIEPAPAGAMLIDGHLDYITDDLAPTPRDAVYVARMDEAGAVAVEKDDTADLTAHTFAGWPEPKGATVRTVAGGETLEVLA